jgi:hypothetical protein|tara:strand:+ start:475 stop:777 length:303 start_codon:yes stop_codon:yes gene_type:complete
VVEVVEQVLQEKQVIHQQEVVMVEMEQILVLLWVMLDQHVQYLQVAVVELDLVGHKAQVELAVVGQETLEQEMLEQLILVVEVEQLVDQVPMLEEQVAQE